jgi:disulfide bond formation protein DsbB
MIENDFPFSEVMKSLFLGSGDCASVEWVLFNMPLAYWSFAGFLVLFALLSTRLFLDKTTTAG